MTLPRLEIRVPPRKAGSQVRLAAQLVASVGLLPAAWGAAALRGVPGVHAGAACARLGLELLARPRAERSLISAARFVLMPMDSTRFFEFDFVERATTGLAGSRYLDVSSPRAVPMLLLRAHPDWRGELINPDARDFAETGQLLAAAGLDARCRLSPWLIDQAPFAPGSFDLVTCVSVLEHIPEDRAAVERMWALLAPGGRLVVTLPAMARAAEQFIDEDEYGLLTPDERGFYFWQRYYDRALLEERVFAVTGPPTRLELYGERVAGTFARNAEEKRRLRRWYPFWREPWLMASGFQPFDDFGQLPGEGVVGLVFDKPGGAR